MAKSNKKETVATPDTLNANHKYFFGKFPKEVDVYELPDGQLFFKKDHNLALLAVKGDAAKIKLVTNASAPVTTDAATAPVAVATPSPSAPSATEAQSEKIAPTQATATVETPAPSPTEPAATPEVAAAAPVTSPEAAPTATPTPTPNAQ